MRKYSSFFKDVARPKTSSDFSRAAKNVVTSPDFLLPVAGAGVVGLAALGQAGFRKMLEARRKSKAYQEMIKAHPHLGKEPETKRRYDTLHKFNPHYAKDPHVAGAWLDAVRSRAGNYGESPSDQGLLDSVGELSGLRNQMTSAIAREKDMDRGPDISRAVGTLTSNAQAAYGKLKAEHGEIGSLKEHNKMLTDKLREASTKDAFKELTGHAPGPERIRAIETAAVLYQNPHVKAYADILADKRKFETFSSMLQHAHDPAVKGIVDALNKDPKNAEKLRQAVPGGFRHRGGQARR